MGCFNKGGYMRYQCFSCNLVKDHKQEKRYVYASSTKNVKVYVCRTCHERKMMEMQDAAAKIVGKPIVLGVLRGRPPSYTE